MKMHTSMIRCFALFAFLLFSGYCYAMPENAKPNSFGSGWECVSGYRQASNACVKVDIPANAKLNYLGNGWECVSGYRQASNTCVKVDIPANAKLNYLGNGWDCVSGYRQASNACVKVDIPANAKLNYLGNGWDCVNGYRQVSNACVKVDIPANAKLNYLGNGWDCVNGYRQVSNACVKVDIPANAKLNYLGNGWECTRGFKISSNSCIAMSAEEFLTMEKKEKAVLAEISARRSALQAGNSCEVEHKTGADVCLKISNITFDCDKSSYKNSYDSCEATISFDLETNYKGRGYLDVEVECRLEIEYSGKGFYSSRNDSARKDESYSLYANGTDSDRLRFDFSFSSFEEVNRAKISSHRCEIDDINLY
jgi:hypothetical protein